MLKGTLKAVIANADVINLSYRDVEFKVDKDSSFVAKH
jgi:hypothetical protein